MSYISKKLVFGVGVKGAGVSWIDGKTAKSYSTWNDMLKRCYCPKVLSRQPTYIGCSVCDEWLYFPTFKGWFDKNYVEGWHLDKDLLVTGNKVYSPDTCIFTPRLINSLFTDSGRARGEHPIGVAFDKQKGKFKANISIDGTRKHIGLFDNVNEAHQAYLTAKKENVIRVANIWKGKIPVRLYEALIRKANDLR